MRVRDGVMVLLLGLLVLLIGGVSMAQGDVPSGEVVLPAWVFAVGAVMLAVIVVLLVVVFRLLESQGQSIALVKDMIPLEQMQSYQRQLHEQAQASKTPYDEIATAALGAVLAWAKQQMNLEPDDSDNGEMPPKAWVSPTDLEDTGSIPAVG